VNLTKYQKGVYLCVKVFNMLTPEVKLESDNLKKFKLVLQKFCMKICFTLWINILNFKKVEYFYI